MGWFSKKKDPTEKIDNSPPAEQTLSDVVRGMAHAASAADAIIDQQFIKQMENFFEANEDGSLRPKMVQVALAGDRIVEVPLITMVDPAILSLDEVTINMVIKLTESKLSKRSHPVNKEMEVTRSSFGVTLTSAAPDSRSDGLRVQMKFKRITPPEGATRILDELAQLITPRDKVNAIAQPSMTQVFGNPTSARTRKADAQTQALEEKTGPTTDTGKTDSGDDFPPTNLG